MFNYEGMGPGNQEDASNEEPVSETQMREQRIQTLKAAQPDITEEQIQAVLNTLGGSEEQLPEEGFNRDRFGNNPDANLR